MGESVIKVVVLTAIGSIVVGLMCLMFYPLYKTIAVDGKVDYCYTETRSFTNPLSGDVVAYDLYGHKPWRKDIKISQNLGSLEQVKSGASTYGCELR